MHGELLHHPFMKPGIVLVTSADGTSTAGGDDLVRHETLHALEFLLFLGVSDFDSVRAGVGVPHG